MILDYLHTGNDNISELVTNATTDILTATIEVTPTYTNAGESCTGPSKEFTITVNPIQVWKLIL